MMYDLFYRLDSAPFVYDVQFVYDFPFVYYVLRIVHS